MKDDYDTFNAFDEYLGRKHAKADWNTLAGRLLKQLKKTESAGIKDLFHRNYVRGIGSATGLFMPLNRRAGKEEIIPLCEVEAQKTGSYTRLVKYLISEKRNADAERWIQEGIHKTEKELPGIASDLRNRLKEIRSSQKDWGAVATMQTEEFVRYPSEKTFTECQKANVKTRIWPKVREHLLLYRKRRIALGTKRLAAWEIQSS